MWQCRDRHNLIRLIDTSIALLRILPYERQKRFLRFWVNFVIGNPYPAGVVDEILQFARLIWKRRDRHELIELLKGARAETLYYSMRFAQHSFGELHTDLEGQFLMHLCALLREDKEHQA